MLTIFGSPRSFRGHFDLIQRNAIRSWTKLDPPPQILLMGNDDGTDRICEELGITHVQEIEVNKFGTPLFSSMIAKAEEHAQFDLMLCVSPDIILFNDVMKAASLVAGRFRRFCAVVARREIEISSLIDFDDASWDRSIHGLVIPVPPDFSNPQTIAGDFFLYRKGFWGEFPPFAIGRTMLDNWMYYRTLALGGQLVDLSPVVTIVHQKHDHSHHPMGTAGVYEGEEAQHNLHLAGGWQHIFFITDATWILARDGFRRPRLTRQRLKRRIETFPVLHPYWGILLKFGSNLRAPSRLAGAVRRILSR